MREAIHSQNDPDIYVVKINDKYLIYSPLRNLAALGNAQIIESLKHGNRQNQTSKEVASLLEVLGSDVEPPPPRTGDLNPIFLGLIATHECNLTCRYCNFHTQTNTRTMSMQLAVNSINDWARNIHQNGRKQLELHFFGGEPFVAEQLVQTAVYRTRALADELGLSTHFEASTNGVWSKQMSGFVVDHFDTIVLSLDGRQAEHDRHRPGPGNTSSFASVRTSAERLRDSAVNLCLRCCVSAENVDALPEICEWFIKEFEPAVIDFEPLFPTPETKISELFPPEAATFARKFIAARKIAGEAGIECVYSPISQTPRYTFCPVGQDALIVNPDGTVSSCYMPPESWRKKKLDLTIGHVDSHYGLQLDIEAIEKLRTLVANRPRCQHCFCRWNCAGGCLVRETFPGHSLELSEYCKMTRIIQACTLLENMGCEDYVTALLDDSAALESLNSGCNDELGAVPL